MAEATAAPRSGSAARILAVARKRFEQVGYRRTSIADIASEAGVAAGTIYRHFENKEDLLLRVVEQTNLEWLVQARRAVGGGGSAPEHLARLGRASIELSQRNTLLNAALDRDPYLLHAPLMDEIHEMVLRDNVALIADVIRDGIEEGTFRSVDPEATAFILFVGGRTLYNERGRSYAEILPLFAEITQEGLRPR